jgi:hypothetical protein
VTGHIQLQAIMNYLVTGPQRVNTQISIFEKNVKCQELSLSMIIHLYHSPPPPQLGEGGTKISNISPTQICNQTEQARDMSLVHNIDHRWHGGCLQATIPRKTHTIYKLANKLSRESAYFDTSRNASTSGPMDMGHTVYYRRRLDSKSLNSYL